MVRKISWLLFMCVLALPARASKLIPIRDEHHMDKLTEDLDKDSMWVAGFFQGASVYIFTLRTHDFLSRPVAARAD